MSASADRVARLLHDLSERWRHGERIRVETFLQEKPGLATDRAVVLDLIYQEVRLREERGEHPTIDEYTGRFPHLLSQLRAQFEVLRLREGDLGERLTREGEPTASAVPVPADRTPIIPGYEILRLLAGGGMGMVYLAQQECPKRRVAIKVIRPERLGSAAAIQRFQREFRIAVRLSHPHIVQVFDANQVNDVHYLVMEFIEGTDLGQRVQQRGPLPVPLACDCIRQAALGLQHAFEQGLVHRDVKPSNLMLSPAGGVKVLDLGLARLRGIGESDESHLTQAGCILGTPDYMAPEQVEDPHRADVRSDLYSLGCTMFYLLTGQVVFPGGSMIQKLDRHRWHAAPAVERLLPDVPPAVAALVARLLAKRPEVRFQTPGELAVTLIAPSSASGGRKPPEEAPRCGMLLSGGSRPPLATLLGHHDGVTGVAFLPDGCRCVSVSRDETLRLWDRATGQEVHQARAHAAGVLSVAVAPDGGSLATGGRDQCVRLWDAQSGRELRCFTGHGGDVTSVVFTPDGRCLLSGSLDQTVLLWNIQTGREVRRIGGTVAERHWDGVLCVAVALHGRRALSGSRDRTLLLWDLATGREVRCLRGLSQPVAGVALAPDGRMAVTASGQTVRLWDLDTGAVLRVFKGHQRAVLCVAFAPSGGQIVSGSKDATVRVWELTTARERCCFTGHSSAVSSVAVAPDGRALLSGDADGSVLLWPMPKS